MSATFDDDGTPVTYLGLARRTALALGSMIRNSQADLTAFACLVRLVRDGDLEAARAELPDLEAYLAQRQQVINDVEVPALAGLDQDIAALERQEAAQRRGTPAPKGKKRWH